MDFKERIARAMCLREGWRDPDQTAHVTLDGGETRRVRRWQTYDRRIEVALQALDDAGLVILPADPGVEPWRAAVASAFPDRPQGSYENRRLAYDCERVFAALVRHRQVAANGSGAA